MATNQTVSVPAQMWPIGTTMQAFNVPKGTTARSATVTIDFSPWTAPSSTTNVEVGVQLSTDNRATWSWGGSCGENTPPPWTIPAKYGGGVSSTGALTVTAAQVTPTDVALVVTIEGAPVALGAISATLS